MAIKFVVEKTLVPGIPSAKAYQLAFSDDDVYIIYLARDWGGFGAAGSPNILGKTVVAAAGGISHNVIAGKLQKNANVDFEELVKKEKGSKKFAYGDIVEFKHKEKGFISGRAFAQFKFQDGTKMKFTFAEEAEREGVVKVIKDKRPDLLQAK